MKAQRMMEFRQSLSVYSLCHQCGTFQTEFFAYQRLQNTIHVQSNYFFSIIRPFTFV